MHAFDIFNSFLLTKMNVLSFKMLIHPILYEATTALVLRIVVSKTGRVLLDHELNCEYFV